MEGSSIRLAKSWTFIGSPVCAIRGAWGQPPFDELRWPAFAGTFAGVPGCTVLPFYATDPLDFHAPTRQGYDYALMAIRVVPPAAPPGEVAQQLLRLTRGLARRLGPPTGIFHDDGMPSRARPSGPSSSGGCLGPTT